MNTMEKVNFGGVDAAQPEKYRRMKEFEEDYHKKEDAWWAAPIVIVLLTVAFSVMDALVLYSVLDKAMMQSEMMGIIMALGIAAVLNIIPLLVAKFIHQAIYRTKRFALTLAILSVVAFVILFGGTVYLRYAYSDMYGGSSSTQLVNAVENEEENSSNTTDTSKGLAVVLLLCLEPLVTSLVNFGLAYVSDDEIRKKIEELEIREIELKEGASDLEAALATMENNVQQDIDLDEQAMLAAKDEVAARCDILRAMARNLLAEHLANASATTKLSHEMLAEEDSVGSDGNVENQQGDVPYASEQDENKVATYVA